jgi:hypothetical protein
MSAVIPAERIARKRQARKEKGQKELLRLYAQTPQERRSEFLVFVRALVDLANATDAVEFAKARKRLLALVATQPSEAQRAQVLRLIADWTPLEKGMVVPLNTLA